jgi:hypothetical protein
MNLICCCQRGLFLSLLTIGMALKGHSQGPYAALLVTPVGIGFAGGLSIMGMAEVGAWYHPQFGDKSAPGYIGGIFKRPFRYKTIKEFEASTLILGSYSTLNLGAIKLPIPKGSTETVSRRTLGWSLSYGGELMVFKSGVIFSIPLELGIGKMHYNQGFEGQEVQTSADYKLGPTLFMMVGIRLFFFKNKCDEYISNL